MSDDEYTPPSKFTEVIANGSNRSSQGFQPPISAEKAEKYLENLEGGVGPIEFNKSEIERYIAKDLKEDEAVKMQECVDQATFVAHVKQADKALENILLDENEAGKGDELTMLNNATRLLKKAKPMNEEQSQLLNDVQASLEEILDEKPELAKARDSQQASIAERGLAKPVSELATNPQSGGRGR
ncbi:MAG: hypothetical protein MK052_02800 [Alphaproteobacteria bacterium]|nr:hypothetical protein [Alphaproteobacteria bacterium]